MADSNSLQQWMKKNQVFDPDLLRLFPKYGVNDPNDLCRLSDTKWKEMQNVLLKEKIDELKDNAAMLRHKKKIEKINKMWKEQTQANAKARRSRSLKRSSIQSDQKANDNAAVAADYDAQTELEELRLENRKIRRELSAKNSDLNRLGQDYNALKKESDDSMKRLTQKYTAKCEEYDNLLRQFKQVNQQLNSKYHQKSAKDKTISSLKTDKSVLLNDINEVMKGEQQRYDDLMAKYLDLKKKNRHHSYKAMHQYSKIRKPKLGQAASMTAAELAGMGKNDDDSDSSNEEPLPQKMNVGGHMHGVAAAHVNNHTVDGFINQDLMRSATQRSKKYKPSKKKRARARQLSEIVTRSTTTAPY